MLISMPVLGSDFKVLSWNAYMLPKPIKYSFQKTRTLAIAEALKDSDYDMIVFQEAFTTSFRNHVKKELLSEYPFSYYMKNHKAVYPYFGSGLFILARKPFQVLDKIYYKNCAVADCFADKGALLVETKLSTGKSVQVTATHMQAWNEYGKIRLKQYAQINSMLMKHKKEGVPQILLGDLNTDFIEPEFELGLEIMGMKHMDLSGEYDHTTVHECYPDSHLKKEWIDHIWISKDTELKDGEMRVRPIEYERKGQVCNASDHHALEGLFTFAD